MNNNTLIALGDSITYGWPYQPKDSWVNTLQENFSKVRVINKGISGDTFCDMLLRLEKDVLSYNPDFCIVMGGANEAYQYIPQPVLKENFLKILKNLRNIRCKTIVGITTPVDDDLMERYLKDIREWLNDYCSINHIPIIDFYKLMLGKDSRIDNTFFLDGCHPNKKGYKVMGEYALRRMVELNIN